MLYIEKNETHQTIKFSNKTLNYASFKELFDRLQKVENIDKVKIAIKYTEKKDNIKKVYEKVFDSIDELLQNVEKIKSLDEIEIKFYNQDVLATLTYESRAIGWHLNYNQENNTTNSIIYVLNSFFKPSLLKNIWLYKKYYIFLVLYTIFMILVCIYSEHMQISSEKEIIYTILIFIPFFILFICAMGNDILKVKKAYKNNKFWENHKVDIIQNIIFYILGVVTPYIISWFINLINIILFSK